MSPVLLLVALGWMYVVVMMSVAEAISPQGSVLGGIATFVLYGALPLALVLYLLSTPARRRRQRAAQAREAEVEAAAAGGTSASAPAPDGRAHATRDPVAAEREEP